MTDPTAAAAFEALLARRGEDVVLIVDDDLRIRRAGAEAAELADRTIEQLAGMSLIAAFGSAPLDAVARSRLCRWLTMAWCSRSTTSPSCAASSAFGGTSSPT
jgi:hypothetical protein